MDEIMEDGNLVDRVRILLQRDMQYYQAKQTVLRESLCGRVSGGKLDFPRHASFAAIKIVKWWEAEFFIAFRYPSGLCVSTEPMATSVEGEEVIKKTPPSEFILLVVDTSQLFIEHLHALIQESLDHADLAVLTATLGAAALVRNCLWCYNQQSKAKIPKQSSEKLYEFYKSYQEMAEAVGERLLDLHCRLISLYILNEADSLSWQSEKYFFEKERSSFIIQMWWLYMQGTKADLWSTVSPKMAQRIFAGMLNESLTIIVARFIHGRPSLQRSEQFWADAFNVLSCTSYLALSACDDGDELIATRTNKLSIVMRDIHAKCGELLVCLLLRGTPLKLLYQICRNGLEKIAMVEKRSGPSPWLLIAAPKLFGNSTFKDGVCQLSEDQKLILQVNVLRSQPQPNWTQLLKVLSMRNCTVARMLLTTLIRQCIDMRETDDLKRKAPKGSSSECGGFLCAGDHKNTSNFPATMCLYSLMYVSVNTPMDPIDVIIPGLKQDVNWSNYLDRQQVWNQSRPPWLNALLAPLREMMEPVVETLLEAVKTGASIYQAMSLSLACITELFVCAPIGILRAGNAMNQSIPAHCHPIGGSVLVQIFCAALYSSLFQVSLRGPEPPDKTDIQETPRSVSESFSFDPCDRCASATALAEALCSIDEDNKHTDQIQALLGLIHKWIEKEDPSPRLKKLDTVFSWKETYVDQLLFTEIGRRSLKVVHEYLLRASDWVLKNLKEGKEAFDDFTDSSDVFNPSKPLTYVMFHIDDTAFDQFLTNFNETNWNAILKMPLSVTLERVRSQIIIRPELKNPENLSHAEREVALAVKNLCISAKSPRAVE
ncbi:uncharacterized protein LOC107045817 [Diachasma alloeum]|uniref:uncharacterized protein LOC107045817 n=1 Tax=Diachasma alloeum TaxID=454923 RepID=UPI0007383A18|nr:uncharacterized protein LOC107045817 [Diachasma alloeum]